MRATHLRQRTGGRIYPFAEHLAKRPDMLPCNAKGEILGGAAAEGDPQAVIAQLQAEINAKDLVIEGKNAEIMALRAKLNAKNTPADTEKPEDEGAGEETGSEETDVTDKEVTLEQVVEAIGQLDPANPEHFTKNKGPRVPALEGVLKASVSPELRDQAWAEVNKA